MIRMNIEIGQKPACERSVADNQVIALGDPDILLREYNLSHPPLGTGHVGFWQIDHPLPSQNMDVSAACAVIRSGFSDPHGERQVSRGRSMSACTGIRVPTNTGVPPR